MTSAREQHPTPASQMDPSDWTHPGVYAVAPGVHRIPLPMPQDGLTAVNVYAIEDGDRLVLIDGGWAVPEARCQLEAALTELDTDVRAISRVLVTHVHRDHYTLAVQLRRETGLQIGLGIGERPTIEILTGGGRRHQAQVELLRRAGADELAEIVERDDTTVDPIPEGWEPPDAWLPNGELQLSDSVLDVIPTPGHTRGHVVFRAADAGLLFAGDHVLPHITPSIGFEPVPAVSPLRDFLASLTLLRRDPDATLLPAHGAPGPSVHDRIDDLVRHHDQRLAEMEDAVRTLRRASAIEVARCIGWTRHQRAFTELDSFNRLLAVTETVAHLVLLVADERLTATADDVPIYELTREGRVNAG